jgi:hypothetical protein
MKQIKALYRFGNFYDTQTKKRILIEDGTPVDLYIPEEGILDTDLNLIPNKFANADEKHIECNLFYWENEDAKFWKLYDAGQLLYFELTAGIRKRYETQYFKIVFQLRLLEDLYIYNRKKELKDARFFKCLCIVEECKSDFEFFEPLYAKSMNDALTKTYELYFSMFGKSTANAFDRLYLHNPDFPVREATEEIQAKEPVKFIEKNKATKRRK